MKTICDPVHGSIAIDGLERELLDTGPMQRLRGIEHLGLASYVYPGADFSRFSHSLGACHVAGRITSSLQAQEGGRLTESDARVVRAAALLHDAGHYPFSHAMEHAVSDYFAATATGESATLESGFRHEELSEELVLHNPEIVQSLTSHGIDPEQVAQVIMRTGSDTEPAKLVSSDLDADRIDYLLRMSHAAGLPYGSVDLEYLLRQVRRDASGHVCIDRRAMRAADHLLMSRIFAYQQVPFHKTVVAFELLLQRVLSDLLAQERIDCRRSTLGSMIRDGRWRYFDDSHVQERIRQMCMEESARSPIQIRGEALLHRKPPALLIEREQWIKPRAEARGRHRMEQRLIDQHVKSLSEEFSLPTDVWMPWARTLDATKASPVMRMGEDVDNDALSQSVLIHDGAVGSTSALALMPESLMSVMGDTAWSIARLYVLLPPDRVVDLPRIREAARQLDRDAHA